MAGLLNYVLYIFKCACSYYSSPGEITVDSLVKFVDYTISRQIYYDHNHIICSTVVEEVRTSLATTVLKSSTKVVSATIDYENRNMSHFLKMYPNHTLECARGICTRIGGTLPVADLNGFITSVQFKLYPTSDTVNIISTTAVKRNTYSDLSFVHIDMTDDIMSRSSSIVIPKHIREYQVHNMKVELEVELRRTVDWLRYHDCTPMVRCISGTVSKRLASSVRLSPYVKVLSAGSKVCGGIAVFDECKSRSVCMLSMCEQLKGATTLIISEQVSFWEDSVNAMVRKPMVYVIHDVGSIRHRDVAHSKYVIVSPRNLRAATMLNENEWFRVIVDVGVLDHIPSRQCERIKSLKTLRRWCVGTRFNMNLCSAIDLWSLITKPYRLCMSHESTAVTRGLTLITKSKHERSSIHLCTMSDDTQDVMYRLSMHLDRSRMYQRKQFIRAMVGLLSTENTASVNDLWDVFTVNNSLPPYKTLLAAEPHSGIMLDSTCCIICFEKMNRPVQLICGHIICYACVSMICKCPACRVELNGKYLFPVGEYQFNNTQNNTIISDKLDTINEFIDTIITDKVKIVIIGSLIPMDCVSINLRDDPCTVENKLFHFIKSRSEHVIRLPEEHLKYCHLLDIDHVIVPFYSTITICSCSTSVKIHHFLYQNSIEHYMYSHNVTPLTLTNRHKWLAYMAFIST